MSKLISTNDYFLLVYETPPPAFADETAGPRAATVAARWSRRLDYHVWHSEPGDVFLVLEKDQKNHLKVLHSERVGWIFDYGWLKLKEIERSRE